jgi:hypothetical protein
VPSREQQVDDGKHRTQTLRQFGRTRHPVRDPGGRDLLLGPGDPGGHRRLRHQQRLRDVTCRDPAHQPQRESQLGVLRQRRMAAQEDQSQPLVRYDVLRLDRFDRLIHGDLVHHFLGLNQ